ncbi:MAG: hypothetical protein U0103_28905 [Candidatus Obscuribacterales bacterium]
MQKLTMIDSGVNAFVCNFAPHLLDEIKASYFSSLKPILESDECRSWLNGGQVLTQPVGRNNDYFLVSFNDYPLLWFSCDSDETYSIYRRFLDALAIEDDIKELIDYEKNLVLYSGFFVVGDHSPAPKWHVDYFPGANAYTLLTPLFEFTSDYGNLLYKDANGNERRHLYQLGEAVLLGDHVEHSTEPYPRSENPRVLVSMSLGTDKIEHWEVISLTTGSQSRYHVLPCGHVNGNCMCQVTHLAQKRMRAKNG